MRLPRSLKFERREARVESYGRRPDGARWRLLLLGLTLPLVASSAVFIWQDYQARRDSIIDQVRLQSAQVNAQLEDFVHTSQGAAHIFSATWLEQHPQLTSDLAPGAETAPPNMYLETFVADKPRFSRAYITDIDGRLLGSSDGFAAGARIEAPFFLARLNDSRGFTVSDVYSPGGESRGALFGYPMMSGGNVQGFLVLESDLAAISGALDMSSGFPESAKAGIFDSRGRILAGTGYQPPHPGNALGKDVSATQVWAQAAAHPNKPWFGPGLDGVDRIVFYRYPDSTPWITTVAYAQSELLNPLWNRLWVFGGVLAATLLAVMLVGEFLIRREQRHLVAADNERRTLDAVMNGATDAMMVLDASNRVKFANRRFGEVFNLAPEYLVGQPEETVRGLMAAGGEDPDRTMEQLTGALWDHNQVGFDTLTLGGLRPLELEMTSYPLHTNTGTHLGRTVVFHDVTALKTVQRMKSQFLATASHQLRTPMTSIMAFSELLLSDNWPAPKRRSWLEHIQNQSTRMSSTIDSMLNVSQLESGRLDLKMERVDTLAICRAIVDDARAKSDMHEIRLEISDEARWILADRERFGHIVQNLVDNATKYTMGKGIITVSTRKREDGFVEFHVRDSGVGIAADEMDKLFTPFHRAPNAKTSHVSGTGLGLYIARSLTELHGGEMWVHSVIDKGATFFFTMPLAVGQERGLDADREGEAALSNR